MQSESGANGANGGRLSSANRFSHKSAMARYQAMEICGTACMHACHLPANAMEAEQSWYREIDIESPLCLENVPPGICDSSEALNERVYNSSEWLYSELFSR